MHGAYIGGKYSLDGYIEVKPIGTVVDEAWGTCGSWSVIRPSRAETVNPCVVAAENADCSIANPSACKWSNPRFQMQMEQSNLQIQPSQPDAD
jgi:hypothetical protein